MAKKAEILQSISGRDYCFRPGQAVEAGIDIDIEELERLLKAGVARPLKARKAVKKNPRRTVKEI